MEHRSLRSASSLRLGVRFGFDSQAQNQRKSPWYHCKRDISRLGKCCVHAASGRARARRAQCDTRHIEPKVPASSKVRRPSSSRWDTRDAIGAQRQKLLSESGRTTPLKVNGEDWGGMSLHRKQINPSEPRTVNPRFGLIRFTSFKNRCMVRQKPKHAKPISISRDTLASLTRLAVICTYSYSAVTNTNRRSRS